jgi:two-component system KDP operon response regulator KdpE
MTRFLIVDDEPQILRALRINLTARQYEVFTAVDGAQALAAARADRPDIVVLDLGLPDIDGVEVIHDLRAWSPVPIVVLSGRVDSHDKVDALDAGADDYVTKPSSVDEAGPRPRGDPASRSGGAGSDCPNRTVHSGLIRENRVGPAPVRPTRTEWQPLDRWRATRQAGQPPVAAAGGV